MPQSPNSHNKKDIKLEVSSKETRKIGFVWPYLGLQTAV